MKRILVVDDEKDLCEILQFNLESEGYQVDTANSAEEALKILSPQHSLILLDVMMEKMSGYQMANIVRHELHNEIPIIFLTAKNTENDILTGLNIGADDYISKPFSLKEVLARVKTVLKRTSSTPSQIEETQISFSQIVLNLKSPTVMIDGQPITVTKKEYLILKLLIQSPNTYYTREEILDKVWQNEAYVLERSVDVHIARLRKKLGIYGSHLVSRAGFGYCIK